MAFSRVLSPRPPQPVRVLAVFLLTTAFFATHGSAEVRSCGDFTSGAASTVTIAAGTSATYRSCAVTNSQVTFQVTGANTTVHFDQVTLGGTSSTLRFIGVAASASHIAGLSVYIVDSQIQCTTHAAVIGTSSQTADRVLLSILRSTVVASNGRAAVVVASEATNSMLAALQGSTVRATKASGGAKSVLALTYATAGSNVDILAVNATVEAIASGGTFGVAAMGVVALMDTVAFTDLRVRAFGSVVVAKTGDSGSGISAMGIAAHADSGSASVTATRVQFIADADSNITAWGGDDSESLAVVGTAVKGTYTITIADSLFAVQGGSSATASSDYEADSMAVVGIGASYDPVTVTNTLFRAQQATLTAEFRSSSAEACAVLGAAGQRSDTVITLTGVSFWAANSTINAVCPSGNDGVAVLGLANYDSATIIATSVSITAMSSQISGCGAAANSIVNGATGGVTQANTSISCCDATPTGTTGSSCDNGQTAAECAESNPPPAPPVAVVAGVGQLPIFPQTRTRSASATSSATVSPPPTPTATATFSESIPTASRSRSASASKSAGTLSYTLPLPPTQTESLSPSRTLPPTDTTSATGTASRSPSPTRSDATRSPTFGSATPSFTATRPTGSGSVSAGSRSLSHSPSPTRWIDSATRTAAATRTSAAPSPTRSHEPSDSVGTTPSERDMSASASRDAGTKTASVSVVDSPGLLEVLFPGALDVSALLLRADAWRDLRQRLNTTGATPVAGAPGGNATGFEVLIAVRKGARLGAALPVSPLPTAYDAPWPRESPNAPTLECLQCIEVAFAEERYVSSSNSTQSPHPAVVADTLIRHASMRRVNATMLALDVWPHELPSNVSKAAFNGARIAITANPSCFDGGALRGSATLEFRAAEPVKPKPAMQQVTEATEAGVNTATVVSSLSGSPGGALAAQRIGTLTAACAPAGDVPEAVPIATSPTQVAVGNSDVRYYLGAALMNPIVGVVFLLLHTGLAKIYGTVLKKTLRQAMLVVRVPSGALVLVLIAAQPTVEAAFVAASRGRADGLSVIMFVTCTFFAASVAGACYLLRVRFVATYVPNDERDRNADDDDKGEPLLSKTSPSPEKTKSARSRVVGALKWLMLPMGEWMVGPLTVEDLCDTYAPPSAFRTVLATPLFVDYNNRGKYFMLVELAMSILAGACVAVEMIAGCVTGSAMLFVSLLVYAVVVFALRPHALPFDKYLCNFMAIGQLVAATMRLAYAVRGEEVRGQDAVDVFVFLLQIAAILRGGFDFYNFVRKLRVFASGARRDHAEAVMASQPDLFEGEGARLLTAKSTRSAGATQQPMRLEDLAGAIDAAERDIEIGRGNGGGANGEDGPVTPFGYMAPAVLVAEAPADPEPAAEEAAAPGEHEFFDELDLHVNESELDPATAERLAREERERARDAFLDDLLNDDAAGGNGCGEEGGRAYAAGIGGATAKQETAAQRASRRERRRARRLLDALEDGDLTAAVLSSSESASGDVDSHSSSDALGDLLGSTTTASTKPATTAPMLAKPKKKPKRRRRWWLEKGAGTPSAVYRSMMGGSNVPSHTRVHTPPACDD